jgi:hypothetical protein
MNALLIRKSKFSILPLIVLVLSLGLLTGGLWLADSGTAHAQTSCTPTATITAPFSTGGVGEFCWQSKNLGDHIQSWGTDVLRVNGVDYTNQFIVSDNILRDTTGTYYVYYKSTTANGHFDASGQSSFVGNCTARWCSGAQFSSMNFNGYTVYNNIWGSTSGTQYIQAQDQSNWWVDANFPETSGVKTYPNSSLDLNGKTLSGLGSCTSNFNVTVPASGSWEVAYDLWVPSEVMIWMYKNGAVGPIAQGWNDDGTPIPSATNVTVGGATWDVYHGGANVVSFVRQGNVSSGTVDIKAILNWIAGQGWISNTSNLGKFQFGFEITSAPNGLRYTLNSYSMSCGGLGGGGTPVPTATPTNTPIGPTPTRTNTPVASNTPTNTAIGPTPTRTNTPLPSNTPTNTAIGPTPTRTNTPLPSNTPTNTPIGPTNTPTNTPMPGGNLCSTPTVITGGGSYSVSASGTCFKYVNAAFVRGGMWSVMNGSSSTVSNVVKWYGGRNETVTNCINDTQTLNGNGAQLNNFTVAKDANNAMYVTVTANQVNTVSISIQNWQNGSGCSVQPTPSP